ncbi:DUF2188 domain-containing protein [Anaerolinea thermophila]|uniref:DUF2188 domain-containing protein n=1 Tax=Anaerolinea thermophila TaxID=167964 RepID=UPI0026EA2FAE|nr:DUF2188 domain-containing protein [Anaerolinea thermophila]
MANNRNVHVVPKGNQWAVKKEGNKRATSIHQRKEKAEKRGREEAKKEHSELIIHRKDGTIQGKDSYGYDPNPPKDSKP